MRAKTTSGDAPMPVPASPFLAGAAIGLAIFGLAGSAVAFGVGLALTQPRGPGK